MRRKSSRPRFRLHLSTALVMTITAGCWMFAQTISTGGNIEAHFLDKDWRSASEILPRFSGDSTPFGDEGAKSNHVEADFRTLIRMGGQAASNLDFTDKIRNTQVTCYGWPFTGVLVCNVPHTPTKRYFSSREIVFNGLIALTSLAALCLALEHWIAWRNKPPRES